jgi:uncharacterized protein YegL
MSSLFDPKKFTVSKAKPLPVVLLLDVSGSMVGGKIRNLNKAVEEMLDTFAQEEKMETEIQVSIITFGDEVKLHLPYTKASQVKWERLEANGFTPMGTALKMAKAMIEDKGITPSRAYRPTVVLVSDGQPNDDWEEPLDAFISNGRSSKCFCMAMAIGYDADEEVLKRFISKSPYLAKNEPNKVFHAENASQIHEFFQKVTMSTVARTRSKNPNVVPDVSDINLDGGTVGKSSFESGLGYDDEDDGYW